jgi:D-cysteine desulfhydrase
MRTPELFRRYPSLQLPFLELASVPTAVERMSAVSEWTGRDDLWMKRDDRISPIYGGNKVRRYELVLADLMARGKKRIVTVGGLASTQVMATSLFGKHLGLPVTAVLFDQPKTRFMQESMLTSLGAGANLIYGGGYLSTAWKAWRAFGPDAYFIPPGAANPLANLGYVDAIFELAEQVARGEMPRPDAIVLPTGSSGTLAAMAIGCALLGWPTEIIGVRITLAIAANRFTISSIIGSTWRFLRARVPELQSVKIRPRFSLFGAALGPGYGHPTAAALEALPQVERLIGASGEVTYSGKALVGLKAIAARPDLLGKTILFWHTLSSVRPSLEGITSAMLPKPLARVYGDLLVA